MTPDELIEGLAEALDRMHEDALRGILPDKSTCTALAELWSVVTEKG